MSIQTSTNQNDALITTHPITLIKNVLQAVHSLAEKTMSHLTTDPKWHTLSAGG